MAAFIAMQASMHAWHAWAHMRHTSLMSACVMHSSMHARHIAMQASSIAIMLDASIPIGRIRARIIVLHMSAQFMHIAEHDIIESSICMSFIGADAQIVHACSQAEQASIHACMTAMSMASIGPLPPSPGPFDIMPIIIESTSHSSSGEADTPRGGHVTPRGAPRHGFASMLSNGSHGRHTEPPA